MVDLLTYLRKLGLNDDFMRDTVRILMNLLMEIEVGQRIDAGYYERNDNRRTYRNGYRQRTWQTELGPVKLRIPKLRSGTYTPNLLNEMTNQRLIDLIEEAFIYPVSIQYIETQLHDIIDLNTRTLMQIQDQLQALLSRQHHRPTRQYYSHLWIDTVSIKVQRHQRTFERIAAVAVGVRASGQCDLLGFEIGVSAHDESFWEDFLGRLKKRGLKTIGFVISDSYIGLRQVLYRLFDSVDWQYSRTHFVQDVLGNVAEADQDAVKDAISTIFMQTNYDAAMRQIQQVVENLRTNWPQAALKVEHYGQHIAHPQGAWLDTMQRIKQRIARQHDAVGARTIPLPIEQPTFETDFFVSHELVPVVHG